jgi:chaperonin GroEL
VVNKLRGSLKVAALKAPGFGERKNQYLDDITILTNGTMVRDEIGLALDKVGTEVLGTLLRSSLPRIQPPLWVMGAHKTQLASM